MLLAGAVSAVAACTVGPDTGPDPEVEAAPYPKLSSVPPRPRLSYTIDQRREIADALVSDRENARYDREVARYEVGLDSTPPPADPPKVIAEPEPPEGGVEAKPVPPPEPLPPGGGEVAELAVRQQVLLDRNNGSIESFVVILERQAQLNREAEAADIGVLPDLVQPNTLPGKPPQPIKGEALAAQPEPVRQDALVFLKNLFGSSDEQPPAMQPDAPAGPDPAPSAEAAPQRQPIETTAIEPEAGPPPAPDPTPAASAQPSEPEPQPVQTAVLQDGEPVTLPFAPRSRELPMAYESVLRSAAETARAENKHLLVEGHGSTPALSLDRARSVASWLMRLGAPPDMVSLKGGGAGEDVIVRLLPADAA